MNKTGLGGWGIMKNGKIKPEILDTIYFWIDLKSKYNRTHISLIGETESLCRNLDNTTIKTTETEYDPKSKSICKNCLRIAFGLDPDTLNNQNVKKALKTVSKNKASNKRLDSYRKVLNKSKSEMQADMEKAVNSSNLKLPDEISQDKESLTEVINASLPALSLVRKTAVLNLDRTVNEFKKADPDSNDYEIIKETHNIKSLIKAIDQIKQFIKQL